MIDVIIPLIEIDCLKYKYTVNEDGTRKLDTKNALDESFSFRFDIKSLEKIVFRDGPKDINIDGKTLHFNHYPNGSFSGILLEDNEYVYFPKGKDTFIDQCKEAYIKQKMIEKFALMIDAVKNDEDDDYDEFE